MKAPLILSLALSLAASVAIIAQETKTKEPEKSSSKAVESPKAEWVTLFNGKDLTGWTDKSGAAAKWTVADGIMSGKKGSGDIWTKARYANFILEVEFKTSGNSGVFFRTDDPKDNVQTGIEIQVDNPGGPNKHSVGAIYDLVPPVKNAGKKDDWNKFVITVSGPNIVVQLNGEKVSEMNLDNWTEPGKNPDGSANKFTKALKDWKREGYIGFQDHESNVSYRNVRIAVLP